VQLDNFQWQRPSCAGQQNSLPGGDEARERAAVLHPQNQRIFYLYKEVQSPSLTNKIQELSNPSFTGLEPRLAACPVMMPANRANARSQCRGGLSNFERRGGLSNFERWGLFEEYPCIKLLGILENRSFRFIQSKKITQPPN
jgi:hypothetical protein